MSLKNSMVVAMQKMMNGSVENSPSKFNGHGWELYHLKQDFNEQHNVAVQHPEVVKILNDKYLSYADKNGVVDFEQYNKK